MKSLKKFLEKKKVEKKFKHAGQGYSLSGSGGPSSGGAGGSTPQRQGYKPPADSDDRRILSTTAFEAASKRLESDRPKLTAAQRRIQEQARKELEEEELIKNAEKLKLPDDERDGIHLIEHTDHISTLLYTCDLLGDSVALPKSEMTKAVEEHLRSIMSEDPTTAAVTMIWTLNNSEKVNQAISLLDTYLNNIINSPTEPKFRRIKTSNKNFMEKISPVKGGIEFLHAVGFLEEKKQNEDGSVDNFLVLPEPNEGTVAVLEVARVLLEENCSIPLKLYRDPKVFRVDSSKPLPKPEIPADFYTLTGAELRKEQQQRSEDLDKLTTMRTSKMRESDAKLRQYNYRYTLIRVRFPNHFVLQGVFSVHENFEKVRDFVTENVFNNFGAFNLADSVSGNKKFDDEEKSLYDYRLAPAALLHFDWDEQVLASFAQSNQRPIYLNGDLEASAQPL